VLHYFGVKGRFLRCRRRGTLADFRRCPSAKGGQTRNFRAKVDKPNDSPPPTDLQGDYQSMRNVNFPLIQRKHQVRKVQNRKSGVIDRQKKKKECTKRSEGTTNGG